MTKLVSQQTDDHPKVSVIVCTLNRAHILETVCLASLAVQELPGRVELIVCDASEDTATETVVREWGSAHPDWACTYVQATQRGSCSQRNQAVCLSHGDLLVFLDDDLELLPGALLELWQSYQMKGETYGGFEILQIAEKETGPGKLVWDAAKSLFWSLFGLATVSNKRRVQPSGYNVGGRPVTQKTALSLIRQAEFVDDVEWMNGGGMSIRREVFLVEGLQFDERLQRYGGYAWAEDVAMSVAIRTKAFLRLVECRRSWAIHHPVPGGRMSQRRFAAARVYNFYLIGSMAGYSRLRRRISWARAQVGLMVGSLAWGCVHCSVDRVVGTIDGWKAVRLLPPESGEVVVHD